MNPTDLTVVAYLSMLISMAWSAATVLIRAWQGRRS